MSDLLDLPEGVYFNLDEDQHHADIGIGSTDARMLAYSPESYWFQSRYNPLREQPETTKAQLYGRAVHTLILEGEEKFRRLYAPKLHPWTTKAGMAEKERFAERGMLPLSDDAWARALQTGAILRGNRYLAEAFSGSVGHEVSVFWRRAGVKWKARFDALKERAIVDLKNVSNERAIAFPTACVRKIGDYAYHAQAALYTQGRLEMARLVADGKVHGDHDAEALQRAVDAPEFAFVFLFLQSAGAPLVYSTKLSYVKAINGESAIMNPLLELGFARIERAAANWRVFHDRFGTETPWVSESPILEFNIEALPPWILRGGDDEAAT